MYAGLTKKNVERSKWRYLSDKEIRVLKYMNESKKKKTDKGIINKMAELTPESEITDAPATPAPVAKPAAEKIPAKKKTAFPKEEKGKQPRKFKTHSEKKEFLKTSAKK
jgi:23S rRNA pseudouridine2605 synthase